MMTPVYGPSGAPALTPFLNFDGSSGSPKPVVMEHPCPFVQWDPDPGDSSSDFEEDQVYIGPSVDTVEVRLTCRRAAASYMKASRTLLVTAVRVQDPEPTARLGKLYLLLTTNIPDLKKGIAGATLQYRLQGVASLWYSPTSPYDPYSFLSVSDPPSPYYPETLELPVPYLRYGLNIELLAALDNTSPTDGVWVNLTVSTREPVAPPEE